MTTYKTFNKRFLALAVPMMLGSAAATAATPSLENAPANSIAQVKAKLSGQSAALGTQFIIKYKNNTDASTMGSASVQSMQQKTQSFVNNFKGQQSAAKANYIRSMALQGHHVIKADKKMTPEQAQTFMQEMMASGELDYIEIDQILKPFATPNDPRYNEQWHYFEQAGGLNLPTAWNTATGAGVTVAVLDTGYRPHADLAANLLPGYDMITNTWTANDGNGRDSDARDPGDAVSRNECGNNQASNSSWHGTHVAGTISAVTNNGEGVAGVAYDAKIVPVRVLGKCGGSMSDIADAIVWASGGSVAGVPNNPNPADVINMSLGGQGSCSSTSQNAINKARANGTVVIVAAGNDNANAANFNPGNCSGVVNVAAVGRNGGRAYYSNYGNAIDVAAPGGAQSAQNDAEGILSTFNSGANSPQYDSYFFSQGTSMATPHVAGVAALIKQAKPDATPAQIESILKSTTRSFPAACNGCGSGIVDAAAAVAAASGGTPPPSGGSELTSGKAVVASGAKSSETTYTLNVPAGSTKVTFTTSGGSGDVDMYVKAGSKATTSSYDCRPYKNGNAESCSFDNPTAGTYYVMLRGYASYSNVNLVGTVEGGDSGGGNQGGGGTVENVSASSGQWARYQLDVPAGMKTLTIDISKGSGDADLYVKQGSEPTDSSYDCRPYKNGNVESCTINNPKAGTWYIGLKAYKTFSGVTLNAQYKP